MCLSVSEHAKGHMLLAYTGQSPGGGGVSGGKGESGQYADTQHELPYLCDLHILQT